MRMRSKYNYFWQLRNESKIVCGNLLIAHCLFFVVFCLLLRSEVNLTDVYIKFVYCLHLTTLASGFVEVSQKLSQLFRWHWITDPCALFTATCYFPRLLSYLLSFSCCFLQRCLLCSKFFEPEHRFANPKGTHSPGCELSVDVENILNFRPVSRYLETVRHRPMVWYVNKKS